MHRHSKIKRARKKNSAINKKARLVAGSRLNRMGSDPPVLTRTPVSTYRHGLCGAIPAQHGLFSLGEDKGDVVINYSPAGLHPLGIVLGLFFFFFTLIIVLGN